MLRMVVPIGRSGWAIAAGYVGLLSFGVCFLGPVALVLGLLAIRDIRRHPEKHGMGRAIFGIVGGAVGTLGLVGMVIALVVEAAKKG